MKKCKEVTEEVVHLSSLEIFKEGMNHLAEAACFLFELKGDRHIALAYMVDHAIQYGEAIFHNEDPLLSVDLREKERIMKKDRVKDAN